MIDHLIRFVQDDLASFGNLDVNDDLLLDGLRILYEKNRRKPKAEKK